MNSFYAIFLVAVTSHPVDGNGSMQQVKEHGFANFAECIIAKDEYIYEEKIKTTINNFLVAPWDRKIADGAFCCIQKTKGADCSTTSGLAASHK
jgi:hypothetical protein